MNKELDWYKKLKDKLIQIESGRLTIDQYIIEVSEKIDILEHKLNTPNGKIFFVSVKEWHDSLTDEERNNLFFF